MQPNMLSNQSKFKANPNKLFWATVKRDWNQIWIQIFYGNKLEIGCQLLIGLSSR